MSDIAIRVENLSKQYRIGESTAKYKTFRDSVGGILLGPVRKLRRRGVRTEQNSFWALKDLTFDVKVGEVMGVIGRNGAGKSTLLKVLSRITEPTAGYADIYGRVGSLLEVGTGFHPELSGRENIYLNGAILGMQRSEIVRQFDAIVSFAEVEKFIDTPVKHYSSGMYLRLAFAVAAHLEPEILVVDEVLAVGDMDFQRKCLGKMGEVASQGRTVLFVSHDMSAIQKLTNKAMVLNRGEIAFMGDTSKAIEHYLAQSQIGDVSDLKNRSDRTGDGLIRIEGIAFLDKQGNQVSSIGAGDPVTLAFFYKSKTDTINHDNIALDVVFVDPLGHRLATISTRFSKLESGTSHSEGVFMCHIPQLNLTEATYSIDLWLAYRNGVSDYMTRVAELNVISADYYGTGQIPVLRKHGAMLLEHQWEIRDKQVGESLTQLS